MEQISKKEVLKNFKKLSEKYQWEVNWKEVNKWNPVKFPYSRRYHRSFYTIVRLKNGKEAFFKYPIENMAKKNFKREVLYSKYIEENTHSLAPKILDYNLKKPYWYLAETLDLANGMLCNHKNSKFFKQNLAFLIIKALSKFQSLSKKRLPKKIIKHSFRIPKRKLFNEKIKYFKKIILKLETSKQTKNFPFDKIKIFLEENKNQKQIKEKIIVHGDFAPDNVYFNKKGKVMFIDWEQAGFMQDDLTNKSFDFANLYLHFRLNKKFQTQLLKEFLKRKIATQKQIQASMILHGLNQLNEIINFPQGGERKYQKQHTKGIINSFNTVF